MFSWTLFVNTNKKGAESSKFLNFFIYTPLFKWDDARWCFPLLCGVSETTMWHSSQASGNTFPHVSLFTKDDDSAKMATAQCCFWQKCFRHYRSIAPPILIGFTHEAKIALDAGLDKLCFQCCALRVLLTVTKQLDFWPTFYKADMTSRALSSHFVSWF